MNKNVKIILNNGDLYDRKEILNPISIPRKNEIIQYNGIKYYIDEVIHHYHESFEPYIELKIRDIS